MRKEKLTKGKNCYFFQLEGRFIFNRDVDAENHEQALEILLSEYKKKRKSLKHQGVRLSPFGDRKNDAAVCLFMTTDKDILFGEEFETIIDGTKVKMRPHEELPELNEDEDGWESRSGNEDDDVPSRKVNRFETSFLKD